MRCSANIYSPALHGKRQGSICHDDKWRIDPLSCSSSRSVDNMAVWWFCVPVFMVLSTFASIVRCSNIIYYENRKQQTSICSLPMYFGLVLVWDGYPLSYKIRESKLFPKLFSRFLCVFKIKS